MKQVLMIAFILLTQNTYADLIKKEWKEAVHTQVVVNWDEKVEYPLVRLVRENATPVIMLHGFSGNAHNFMDLGPDLYNAGYDVWSFTWSAHNDRTVQKVGELTVKEMVDYVYAQTGKKAFLVGHSLGGIISKIYAFGIEQNESTGIVTSNRKKQIEASLKIKGVVSLASPNGMAEERLREHLPMFRALSSIPYKTNYKDLSRVVKNESYLYESVVIHNLESSYLFMRLPYFQKFVEFSFNMKHHNFFNYDIGRLFRYGTYPIPDGIKNDVRKGEITNYVDIFFNTQRLIPMAYVAGNLDDLAPGDVVAEEANTQNSDYLGFDDAGHMDLLLGNLQPEVSEFMINFFKKNK